MSRVANSPVELPKGVVVTLGSAEISIKGTNGTLAMQVNAQVEIKQEENVLTFAARSKDAFSRAMSGTTRALVNNMVTGVSTGFEKKLDLVGVGYRAALKEKQLNLQLGYSHDINFDIPEGIKIVVEKQTTVKVSGSDKQQVGMVCSKIKSFRKPEPYKGKGIREKGQHILRKEGKKK